MRKGVEMENWNIWKYIKVGFWLGIGFSIPQFIVFHSGTAITLLAMPLLMEKSFEQMAGEDDSNGNFSISALTSKFDITSEIKIEEFREARHGDQLLILGIVTNNGKKAASSIQLEAELKDENGKFVYECTKYINKRLKPGEKENFQIKCGCGSTPLPKYVTIDVRVVSASRF